MSLTLQELSRIADAELRGDPERIITHVATLQDADEGAISFLANRRYASFPARHQGVGGHSLCRGCGGLSG